MAMKHFLVLDHTVITTKTHKNRVCVSEGCFSPPPPNFSFLKNKLVLVGCFQTETTEHISVVHPTFLVSSSGVILNDIQLFKTGTYLAGGEINNLFLRVCGGGGWNLVFLRGLIHCPPFLKDSSNCCCSVYTYFRIFALLLMW
jgi:hypothetical protein